jgi:hypothetical protein
LLDASRHPDKPNAFRRHRKIPFASILAFFLAGPTASVQNELNAFFATLANQAELVRRVSAQAFSKARQGFTAKAFELLNQRLLEQVETHFTAPRWRGFRIVAADASKLQLFLQDAATRKVREAIAFVLYLPGLELSLAWQLYDPCCDERQMLFEHLHHLRRDDLLVLDRGYPSLWLVAALLARGIAWCIRVDDTGFGCVKTFRRSGLTEAIVTLPAPSRRDASDYQCPCQPHTVRLILVVTPNGRRHVVMTSLLDTNAYPAQEFADLYHARWRIEEAFKRIKHRLNLEHLSGLSWLAAQQDLGAKIVCDNLAALAVYAAAPEPIRSKTTPCHVYKINRTYALAHLKRCLPRWLLTALPTLHALRSTLSELLKNLVRFVSGASKPRPARPKPHKHFSYKPKA